MGQRSTSYTVYKLWCDADLAIVVFKVGIKLNRSEEKARFVENSPDPDPDPDPDPSLALSVSEIS